MHIFSGKNVFHQSWLSCYAYYTSVTELFGFSVKVDHASKHRGRATQTNFRRERAFLLWRFAFHWKMSQSSSALGIDVGQSKFTSWSSLRGWRTHCSHPLQQTSHPLSQLLTRQPPPYGTPSPQAPRVTGKTRLQSLGLGPAASPIDVVNERLKAPDRFTYPGSDLGSVYTGWAKKSEPQMLYT